MIFSEISKKRISLILICIIILIIVGFLFTKELFFAKPSKVVLPEAKREIKVDFQKDLFQNPKFTGLKQYGRIPVKEGKKGKDNPFKPFEE